MALGKSIILLGNLNVCSQQRFSKDPGAAEKRCGLDPPHLGSREVV